MGLLLIEVAVSLLFQLNFNFQHIPMIFYISFRLLNLKQKIIEIIEFYNMHCFYYMTICRQ